LVVAISVTGKEGALSEAEVCADGRLSDELAAILEPKVQDALDHPLRREILRVLHAKERPCGLMEVAGELRAFAQSEVSYHLRVLQGAGAVFADGAQPAVSGGGKIYRSTLAEDAGVIAALKVTELPDRKRWQHMKGGGSTNLLKMFRVPRPRQAIRLSMRSDRKAKPAK
jgi:DNA-binding transcriptional ArsR family regulator